MKIYCALSFFLIGILSSEWVQAQTPPVRVIETPETIVINNGRLELTINKKAARISSISAIVNGVATDLTGNSPRNGLYLDVNGGPTVIAEEKKAQQPRAGYGSPAGSIKNIRVVKAGPDVAEVALESSPWEWFPFAMRYHFRLSRGDSGFYGWVVYSHDKGMPAGTIAQTRFVFRGRPGTELFTHHIVDDQRRGPYPISPIVETLQDATSRLADGTAYTKYDNSAFSKDFVAHGLAGNGIGLWVIWPSVEYLNGGPFRQDLTVHEDSILLTMFHSGHYGAGAIEVAHDEKWSKFCGPVYYYVNTGKSTDELWTDAKARAAVERAKWPYQWVKDLDYPLERASVTGQVELTGGNPARNAWVILNTPEKRDWALAANGYNFYVRTDDAGKFKIDNVRPGKYNLYVSGADQFDDYVKSGVEVVANKSLDLGKIDWVPVTHGRRIWQVGVADRGTAEFMDGDNPRNYDTYKNYFARFPNDVTFHVGKSHEKQDWYYAHWNWFNKTPARTIAFDMPSTPTGKATLTIGLASSFSGGGLEIAVNGKRVEIIEPPRSGGAGYRSGSQDSIYTVHRIEFEASQLRAGANQVTFQQRSSRPIPTDAAELAKLKRPDRYVMYDAIRLEIAP